MLARKTCHVCVLAGYSHVAGVRHWAAAGSFVPSVAGAARGTITSSSGDDFGSESEQEAPRFQSPLRQGSCWSRSQNLRHFFFSVP